ncbi:hypothetical protein [Slackia isoflavoniconvertens]|uniref:Type VI secretion system spike protein VgrG3-like C-terminal domain-containing protein n=1 Tax=Slackia isoflavoniconvertens TaxID=572010 RepID=A0A3N0IC60_9ACTN|nr:hypothetical protein [Slackia isoflavoniconvertens]MBB3279031.1 hypothetical protein [Slackia isoflavoniconvertens]RNM34599.1 hypothetical protein DMP05_05960 [Slackia isoflavoniconvertens]
MALSHFAYVRRNVISSGVTVAMAATMAFPAVALADSTNGSEEDSAASRSASLESGVSVDETDANSAGELQTNYVAETTGVQVNKEDYYSEEGSPEALISLFSMGRSASGLRPVNLSSDVTYFGAYEGGSYAQTLSSGDGFHAVGYYQFDNRYGLLDFIRAVYAYDPSKYSMFEQFNYIADSTFKADNAMRQNGQFTALGVALNSSWKAAYAADAEEFSRLQDGWEYIKYIEPALDYLDSRGIDIYSRADAVQGLCASLCNLFGLSGWHKFVGGYSDGYDWNGFYNSWKYWDGCGLNNDMTDAEFVSTLCDYVVENVGVFYKGQPQYHQGWQNRYKREKAQCLAMIAEHGDTHVKAEDATEPDQDGSLGGGSSSNEGSESSGNGSTAAGDANGSASSNAPSNGSVESNGGNVSAGSAGSTSGDTANSGSVGSGASAGTSGGQGSISSGAGNAVGDGSNGNGNSGAAAGSGASSGSGSILGEVAGSGSVPGSGAASDGSNASTEAGGSNGASIDTGNNASSDASQNGALGGEGEAPSDGSSDDSHENNAGVAQDGQKGDGDSLSLAKALGNESDAGASKTASDASQGDQAAVNQAEQGDRISQTNDSMKGLIIAMAAIAVAALSVIGVVVFRMTHRRDDR